MYAITSTIPQFFDLSGDPLDAGKIYIGTAGANPITTPVAVFWDEAGTQPAQQPIRTVSGYPARNGKPARVYVGTDDFSMTVMTLADVVVTTELSVLSSATLRVDLFNNTALSKGADMVGFNPTLNYVMGTIGARLAGDLNPKDFPWLAKGDGINDDSAAINACIAWGSANGGARVVCDIGDYFCGSQILPKPGVDIIGKRRGSWDAGDTGVQFIKGFATGSLFYSPSGQTLAGCVFEDFWVNGRKDQVGYTGHGIEIKRLQACTFRRVWVRDAPGHGFFIGSGNGSDYHNYFYNCYAFFNGSDGYNIASDFTRAVDCWADGNLSGFNISGGSYTYLVRPHCEEFQTAGIYSSGTNGYTNAHLVVEDAVIISRPYQTAWEASAIKAATGQPGYSISLVRCRSKYETNHAALGSQVAYNFATDAAELKLIDCVESGYSASMTHGTVGHIHVRGSEFNSPLTLGSQITFAQLASNRFKGATVVNCPNTATGNQGYGDGAPFTPIIEFGGASVGLTTSTNTARWYREGKMVFVQMTVVFTNKGSSAGSLTARGLPVPAVNGQAPFLAMFENTTGVSDFPVYGYVNPSDQKIYFRTNAGFVTNSLMTNTSSWVASFWYES